MYGIGDLFRGCGIDCRAVNEQAVGVGNVGCGKRGLEDLAKDIGDVCGFRKDSDSGFLFKNAC